MIAKLGLWAFLIVLAVAPVLGGAPAGEKYRADALLLLLRALVLVAGVCSATGSGKRAGLNRVPTLAMAAFAGWTVLSLLIRSSFLTSSVLLFAMVPATLDALCFAVIFTLAQRLDATDANNTNRALTALGVGFGLTALLVVREFGETHMRAQGILALSPQLAIGFFSPNFAAGFLALCLPLGAALCLCATERLTALLWGCATALGLGALVATGSRVGVVAAVLGLVIALGLGVVSQKGKLSAGFVPRLLALLGASAVLAFGCRQPLVQRSEVSQPGKSQPSSAGADAFRKLTWQGTAKMAQASPLFGSGPGTFPYLYPRYALVAQTDLAHQSYLQTAAESGAPATLAAVVALVLALVSGVKRARTTKSLADAALVGGLCAALIRNCFDSEWSLLGNALPLFALAGLASAGSLTATETKPGKPTAGLPLRVVSGIGLFLVLLVLGGSWPAQPSALARTGKVEEAAVLEPTPRWYFQLARHAERVGDAAAAVGYFEKALIGDPNSLQTLRALAEAQEKAGRAEAAKTTWQRLITVSDGPVGQIRAIPESTETHPAFAYAALARAGETALWEKCAAVIEAYADTPPVYQRNEFSLASPELVLSRRAEVRALYEEALNHLSGDNAARRDTTLQKLDAFVKP